MGGLLAGEAVPLQDSDCVYPGLVPIDSVSDHPLLFRDRRDENRRFSAGKPVFTPDRRGSCSRIDSAAGGDLPASLGAVYGGSRRLPRQLYRLAAAVVHRVPPPERRIPGKLVVSGVEKMTGRVYFIAPTV